MSVYVCAPVCMYVCVCGQLFMWMLVSELRFSCLQSKYSLSHLFRLSFPSLGPDSSLACDALDRTSYVYAEVNGYKVKRRGGMVGFFRIFMRAKPTKPGDKCFKPMNPLFFLIMFRIKRIHFTFPTLLSEEAKFN